MHKKRTRQSRIRFRYRTKILCQFCEFIQRIDTAGWVSGRASGL